MTSDLLLVKSPCSHVFFWRTTTGPRTLGTLGTRTRQHVPSAAQDTRPPSVGSHPPSCRVRKSCGASSRVRKSHLWLCQYSYFTILLMVLARKKWWLMMVDITANCIGCWQLLLTPPCLGWNQKNGGLTIRKNRKENMGNTTPWSCVTQLFNMAIEILTRSYSTLNDSTSQR